MFLNAANSKYVGEIPTNQNCIHEEMKRKLNLGNDCYNAAEHLWSSGCYPKLGRQKYEEIVTEIQYI
jgi:hypothetical protein